MERQRSLPKKILSLTAYVGMALLIAFVIADRHPPTLAVGAKAPLDEKIVRMNGGATLTFRKLLTRPMVINFWATWCPPCHKELPAFSKLAKRYANKIIFVGAALNSDPDEINAVKAQYLLNYELIAINDALADLWQARTLPTTYIVDMKGTITWSRSGVVSEEELEDAINAALAPR